MTKTTMTDAKAKQIGKRIAKLRKEKDLSQRDIAGPGCSYAYVSRIENGARKPSINTLRYFAEKLDTTVEYLETGKHAIMTVMLDDFEDVLIESGIPMDSLSFEEIKYLGTRFRQSIRLWDTGENPILVAVDFLVAQRAQDSR